MQIAAHSGLVAFVPRRLCEALATALDLVVLDAPADPGLDDETMFYPVRAAADPGGRWLRALVQEIGGQLDGAKRTRSRTRSGAHRASSPRGQPSARKTTHAPRAV